MENMTISQLKEVAKQKGITIPAKSKKADIIILLSPKKEKVATKNFNGEY